MKKIKLNNYFSIHYSFLILLLASIIFNYAYLLILYFICLVLHELAHALVAKRLGYRIGKIKLMASGALLEAESDEFSFSDEILIAISGPLFNLFFCLVIIVFWWLVPESFNFTQDLCVINLAIFAFNVLPIFPLDGGRILLAVLSKKLERKYATKITKLIAIIISLLMFFVFVVSLFSMPNFNLAIMSVTLFSQAIAEDKQAVYRRAYFSKRKAERTKKNGVEVRLLYVNKNMPILKLYRMLDARHYTIFVLVDDNMKQTKLLKEDEVIKSLTNRGGV